MKKIWQFVLAGIAVAIGGLFVSELAGKWFNGMDYGSACILGICLYLCVVVVSCTGILFTKLEQNANERTDRED